MTDDNPFETTELEDTTDPRPLRGVLTSSEKGGACIFLRITRDGTRALSAAGVLQEDFTKKGKDYSGIYIFTSYIHYAAYSKTTDTTSITTKNSTYHLKGDMLTEFGVDATSQDYFTVNEILEAGTLD